MIAASVFVLVLGAALFFVLSQRPSEPKNEVSNGAVTLSGNVKSSRETHKAVSTEETVPVSLENASVVLSRTEFDYTGSEIRPDELAGVLCGAVDGVELTEDVDFTVSYSGNISAGRLGALLTVSGVGAYTGEKSAAFSIMPSQVAVSDLPSDNGDLYLSWDEVVGADGYQLVCCLDENFEEGRCTYKETEGTFFDFSGSVDDGEKLFIKIRAFTVTEDASFSDEESSLRVYGRFSPAVKLSAKEKIYSIKLSETSFVYSDEEICPHVAVYSGKGEKLIRDFDFTVEYINNSSPGVASAVVTGTGDYTGQISADFVIKPKKNHLELESVQDGYINVSWSEDPYCDGYIILYSAYRDFSEWYYLTANDFAQTSAEIDVYSFGADVWYLKMSAYVVTNRERGSWKGVYSDVLTVDLTQTDPEPVADPDPEEDPEPSRELTEPEPEPEPE
ncbi:MAG: hypothetical protein IJV00_10840, partial [Clostridia bacterium]|nr:hypothetical protein [Clostridia bacterium]